MSLGYAFVHETLALTVPAPARPARRGPVTRVETHADHVAVPARSAPDSRDPLVHLLFALKHEGTDLGLLLEALARIPAADVHAEIHRHPGSRFARIAGALWEVANGRALDDLPTITGAAQALYDPAHYVTGPAQRLPRWRVDFNGLGSLRWSATVRRTPEVDRLLALDVPARANAFAAGLDGLLRDRALAWAYLDETRASYAIERETPAEDRARAFVALLHQAHLRRPLDEDYLAGLQRATVSNPLDRAMAFRHRQNWLQGPLRGAAGVTYVPPPPALAHELMAELMAFANAAPGGRDAMVAAAVVSFGFVLIHPFMDGNGRLSRFLFHHSLCRSGVLADGLILPVSVAMKKHEADYLNALRTFSAPARERWSVHWQGGDDFDLRWQGDAAHTLYRHWDATACVAFGLRMAQSALEVELRNETEYLDRHDRISRQVGERFDLRGSDLATLVTACLDHGGKLSKRRRDQFAGTVPAPAFDAIEAATRQALAP